jgi:hypothetical protein
MQNESGRSNKDPKKDRRRFLRYETKIPVATRRDDLPGKDRAPCGTDCHLWLQDFSLTGLKVESAIPLKTRERVTLRLPSTATQPPIEVTGRVIRCRRLDTRYQVGIELCQTRNDPLSSPYLRMPRLFSMAADYGRYS